MRILKSSVFWGAVLVIAGGMLMLDALGFLGTPLIWSAIFAVGGVAFLYAFFKGHDLYWWAAIPGFALLGLAAVTAWDQLAPPYLQEVGGALLLGAIGIGFLALYLASYERWWALIPGGTLITLAAVVALSSTLKGAAIAVVLFVGLGATLALLAILPTGEGRMRWPLVPAAILALVGLLVGIGAAGALSYVWPAALIVAGLYLIYHTFGSGRRPRPHA